MSITVENFKMGADPELFVSRTTPGYPWISAAGIFPGDKKNPHRIDEGAVQVDGMAVEYNIDPAVTAEEFAERNFRVLRAISKMAPDFRLVTRPSVTFSEAAWNDAPEEAKIMGCDPDFNAYTGMVNVAPKDKDRFRAAGGHIHIGWTSGIDTNDAGHIMACRTLIKELDIFLGLPMAWMDNSPAARARKQLYGKAGSYRVKPYGVEYRTLSNSWVGNEEIMKWIFENAKLAFSNLLQGKSLATSKGIDPVPYINGSVPEESYGVIPYLCKEYGVPLPEVK